MPQKDYLLPAGLFFTDSVLFRLFFVLQTLSLLFLCKNLLEILRNSRPSRISLFPARYNYFIKGTNLANQIMNELCMKGVFKCAREDDKKIQECQALKLGTLKLGDAPVHPPRNIQGDSSI